MPFTVRQLKYGDTVVIRRNHNAEGSLFDKLTVLSGDWLSWAGGATAYPEAQWTFLNNGGNASNDPVATFSAGTVTVDSHADNSRLVLTENFTFNKNKSWTKSNSSQCDGTADIQLTSSKGKLLFRTSPTKSSLYSNTPFRIGRPDNNWQLQNCGGRATFAPGKFDAGFDVHAILASDVCLSCTAGGACADCPNCQTHPACAPEPCQCLTVDDCRTCDLCAGNPICESAMCVCESNGINCVSCETCEGWASCALAPNGAEFLYGDRAVFEAIADTVGPAAQMRLLPASGDIELADAPATGTVVRLTNPATQEPGGVIQIAARDEQAVQAQTFFLSHSTRYVRVSVDADAACGTLNERYLTFPTTGVSSATQFALEPIAPPGAFVGRATTGVRIGGLYRLRGLRGVDSLVAWRCNLSNRVFWGPESSIPAGGAVLHFRVLRVDPATYVCPDMSGVSPPAKLECTFTHDCDAVAQTGCASNSVCEETRLCTALDLNCTEDSCPAFHFCDQTTGMCLDEREYTPPGDDNAPPGDDNAPPGDDGSNPGNDPPNQTLPSGAECSPDSAIKCANGLICSNELRVCVADPGNDKKWWLFGVIGLLSVFLIVGAAMLVVARLRKSNTKQKVNMDLHTQRSNSSEETGLNGRSDGKHNE